MVLRTALLVTLAAVVAGCSATRHTAATAPPAAPRRSPLEKVDWPNITIPGSVCGFRRRVQLHRHHAFVHAIPRRFAADLPNQHAIGLRRGVYISAGWSRVLYGRIGDPGHDVAALNVSCSNGGGTADGNFAYGWLIFATRHSRPSVLGIVTPKVKPLPNELPTGITIGFRRGRIRAREAWYGPQDGTCCPSGRARTTWTYARSGLHAEPTVVIRRPRKHY